MLFKVCVNGVRRPGAHPALPVTPAQIAAVVAQAAGSGAGAAHVHVKDAAGVDTFDDTALGAVLTSVRAAAPGMPVGVTTGGVGAARPGATSGSDPGVDSAPGLCVGELARGRRRCRG